MTPQEAKEYLDSFINYEVHLGLGDPSQFKLSRVEYLLELLGGPHKKLKFIHIAGTKGKGSTCAFAANILKYSGYRVGLYTSPHFCDLNERIRILSLTHSTPPWRGSGATLSPSTSSSRPLAGRAKSRGQAPTYLGGIVEHLQLRSVLNPARPAKRKRAGEYNRRAEGLTDPLKKHDFIFEDCISDQELCSLIEKTQPYLEKARLTTKYGRLSYFEVLTVLALYYFFKQNVDVVVLETGLGGRLDATNVVDSLVCGITPISLEHTQQLGNTLDKIAQEKAGILKDPNQLAVIALQPLEVYEVIKKRCEDLGIRFYTVGKDILFHSLTQEESQQRFEIKAGKSLYRLSTSLVGRHQVVNAATAVGLIEAGKDFGFQINEENISDGIAQCFWPGRFEIIQKYPWVILDCAHNPSSCLKLKETVLELFPQKKILLILGVSQDKDILGICQNLQSIAARVITTKANHPRAFDFTQKNSKDLFPGCQTTMTESVKEAVSLAFKKVDPEDVILITGSIFAVGEARALLIPSLVI